MEQLPHYLMNKLIEFYSESENTKKVPWTWVFHPSDIKLVEESTTIPKLDGYICIGGSMPSIGIYRHYIAGDHTSSEYHVVVITNRSDSSLLYAGVKREMLEIKIDTTANLKIFGAIISNPIIENWHNHNESFKNYDLWRVIENDSDDIRWFKDMVKDDESDCYTEYCRDDIRTFDVNKVKCVAFICDHDNDEDDVFSCDWDFYVYYVDDIVVCIRTHVD